MSHKLSTRERMNQLEAMLENPAWEDFLAELQRREKVARTKACTLNLPTAERDGAAGAANELESLLNYGPSTLQILKQANDREQKEQAIRNQPTQG